MKVLGAAEVLTPFEMEQIIETAMRILAEVGVQIPNPRVLSVFAEHGAQVDFDQQMVFFPQKWIEAFLAASIPEPPPVASRLEFWAGAYPQYYRDPHTHKVGPHTFKTVVEMTRLADRLKNIDFIYDSMGVPSDVPDALAPLYMRLILWKYSRKGTCGQVQLTSNLPYILEMSEIMAEASGRPLSEIMPLTFQMISPLRFGKEELEQYLFFWERGLPAFPGQILTTGGTGPVTLAGTIALGLAENLLVNFMNRLFYGVQSLQFSNSSTVLDLKKAVFQYGRPELGLTHLAFGQIAR
ncbi:MAG: trimethylamine methyltransferase family protein, partial [Anaerolineales bacterium]|nr:trimethylamine methyltransferase family protein [Anaerolineales bacterium]